MKQIIILMTLFGFLSCKPSNSKDTEPKVLLIDNFDDNSNGWVFFENDTTLIQKIDNGKLYLESLTDKIGVISYIDLKLNDSRDFSIETMMKIEGNGDLAYASFDFGILKQQRALRDINGVKISTTFGDKSYYFGFSDENEILVTKWNKGKETYYFRGYNDSIKKGDFNKLLISKKIDSIYYYLNDNLIFKQRFHRLFGNGFGFSTAPNSKLWIEYIKILN